MAQTQAYERALPPNNYPARAAVMALGELARQALNDAQDLSDQIENNGVLSAQKNTPCLRVPYNIA